MNLASSFSILIVNLPGVELFEVVVVPVLLTVVVILINIQPYSEKLQNLISKIKWSAQEIIG